MDNRLDSGALALEHLPILADMDLSERSPKGNARTRLEFRRDLTVQRSGLAYASVEGVPPTPRPGHTFPVATYPPSSHGLDMGNVELPQERLRRPPSGVSSGSVPRGSTARPAITGSQLFALPLSLSLPLSPASIVVSAIWLKLQWKPFFL